ncbi:hypothetical protein AOLI_G00194740 [Acnodon oligacanthus]
MRCVWTVPVAKRSENTPGETQEELGWSQTTLPRISKQELKSLRRRFKQAREDETGPLAELRNILCKKFMTLRRAEWHWRRRKERARKRAAFIANPFQFTKQLLGKKRNGQLTCSKAEIDCHLRDTFCDRSREQDLSHCQHLIDPPTPTLDFDWKELSLK